MNVFKKFYWSNYSRKRLLNLKLSELGLHSQKAPRPIQNRFEEVLGELNDKGLDFQPHFWCSDEWFCPDGIAGIAIPFFLYHPVLRELERSFMGKVEGESKVEFKKLLRHEIGHAIDNAFGLRKLKSRQKLFGLTSTVYPESYIRPELSHDFVDYLGDGYARSHPDEDWAETFATWLDPLSTWEQTYQSGGARDKLLYVDALMERLKGVTPRKQDRIYWSTRNINITLGEYYNEKSKRFKVRQKRILLSRISKVFTTSDEKIPATTFLKENRKQFTALIQRKTSKEIDFAKPLYEDLYAYCKTKNLEFTPDRRKSFELFQASRLEKSIMSHYSQITM